MNVKENETWNIQSKLKFVSSNVVIITVLKDCGNNLVWAYIQNNHEFESQLFSTHICDRALGMETVSKENAFAVVKRFLLRY